MDSLAHALTHSRTNALTRSLTRSPARSFTLTHASTRTTHTHATSTLTLSRTRTHSLPPSLSQNNLAVLLKAIGKITEAEPLCRATLTGRMKVLGEGHPNTLSALSNLASLVKEMGKHDEVGRGAWGVGGGMCTQCTHQ
jgi:hypothetical protein